MIVSAGGGCREVGGERCRRSGRMEENWKAREEVEERCGGKIRELLSIMLL